MPKKRRGHRASGDLPGEYAKRSLVTVTLPTLGAGGRYEEDHYIVMVRQLDGQWTASVEYKGQVFTMPHKVVLSLGRMQKAIIKARRSDVGKEVAERLLRQAMESEEPAS